MIVSIISVDIEVGKPGARGWSKAVVTYNIDGATRRQNVLSFANPAVYAAVQKHIGETVEVSITKNAKGYDEWAAVSPIAGQTGSSTGAVASAPTANSSATRVTGSNYETPAERARRQVLIVRQSSLSNAIEALNVDGQAHAPEEYTDLAQIFVDFVFDEGGLDGPTE